MTSYKKYLVSQNCLPAGTLHLVLHKFFSWEKASGVFQFLSLHLVLYILPGMTENIVGIILHMRPKIFSMIKITICTQLNPFIWYMTFQASQLVYDSGISGILSHFGSWAAVSWTLNSGFFKNGFKMFQKA